MAISLVGTTQSGSFSGTAANSVTWPSTTVDDVIILLVSTVGSGVTFDTGNDAFTSIFNSVLATNDPRIVAAYHVIDGGEDGASFTYTSDSGPGSAYTAFALRGVDTTNVIDATGSAVSNTNTATTAVTGVTTGTDGNWAIVFGSKSEASGNPSSWDNTFTEIVEASIGSGGSGIAINSGYKNIATAGAVGTTTVSWSGGNDRNIGQMFSVNVASTGRTVDCTAASLAVTEVASGINATREVNGATPEALAVTTYAASLDQSKVVDATLAALSLTEQAGTVNLTREIDATAGALATTANASTVELNRDVSGTLGTLSLSELASTVNLSREIDATTGSKAITTYAFASDSSLTVECTVSGFTFSTYGVPRRVYGRR